MIDYIPVKDICDIINEYNLFSDRKIKFFSDLQSDDEISKINKESIEEIFGDDEVSFVDNAVSYKIPLLLRESIFGRKFVLFEKDEDIEDIQEEDLSVAIHSKWVCDISQNWFHTYIRDACNILEPDELEFDEKDCMINKNGCVKETKYIYCPLIINAEVERLFSFNHDIHACENCYDKDKKYTIINNKKVNFTTMNDWITFLTNYCEEGTILYLVNCNPESPFYSYISDFRAENGVNQFYKLSEFLANIEKIL